MERACEHETFTTHDLVFSVSAPGAADGPILVVSTGRRADRDLGGGLWTLGIAGELDAYSGRYLPEVITGLTGGVENVVIDLAEVTFIDSSGVVALERLCDVHEARRSRVWLHEPSIVVRHLIDLLGLDDGLAFCSDRATHA